MSAVEAVPLAALAEEVADDLAYWPFNPTRILQIGSTPASFIIAAKLPSTYLFVLSESFAEVSRARTLSLPIEIRRGRWEEIDWGTDYEIVLCFDLMRHLAEADMASLLNKAHGSLASGGRILAIERIPVGSGAARELEEAGKLAGYANTLVTSMTCDVSWSVVVFERDDRSARRGT